MTAKLITYLDEYKMYSISSQLFEGLTQEVVQYDEQSNVDSRQQKGPLHSGRLLADIVSGTRGKTERRFLFDYAYTVFEKRLVEDDLVQSLSAESPASSLNNIGTRGFVRVTGPLRLNDVAAVKRTTVDYNKMVEAMNYVTGAELRNAMAALIRVQLASAQGKDRYELEKQLKGVLSAKNEPAMDPKFLEHLAYMFDFGFGDHLEAQVDLDQAGASGTLFTAVLDRSALREDAAMWVRKYSRRSEVPFTIFGVVTQHSSAGEWNAVSGMTQAVPQVSSPVEVDSTSTSQPDSVNGQQMHLKVALSQMTVQIGKVEDAFFGRLPNEVIIDPIAIYREL